MRIPIEKMSFTDFNEWITNAEYKALELIDIGPEEKREFRGDMIFEILLKATNESVHYSYTEENAKEIVKESLFKIALSSDGKLIPPELSKIAKSYKSFAVIRKHLSKELSNMVLEELRSNWLEDEDVTDYIQKRGEDLRHLLIGAGTYGTKQPHRPADLLLNCILYKCHLAFERKSLYKRNNKIAEFINALYNREIFPSTTGAELVRKRINYLFKTKSEERLEKQWQEIFKYPSSRFGLRFDLK